MLLTRAPDLTTTRDTLAMADATDTPNTFTAQRETAQEHARLYAAIGRRFRTARRNSGFVSAAAYARAHALSVRSVQRLEAGRLRLTGPILRATMPLLPRGYTIDRLWFGKKPIRAAQEG